MKRSWAPKLHAGKLNSIVKAEYIPTFCTSKQEISIQKPTEQMEIPPKSYFRFRNWRSEGKVYKLFIGRQTSKTKDNYDKLERTPNKKKVN